MNLMMEHIAAAKYKNPKHFSTELKHLIKNLLQTNLTKRFFLLFFKFVGFQANFQSIFRYGNMKNGIGDIKNHPWFADVDYIKLLNKGVQVPYVPPVAGPTDTSQFDNIPDVPLRKSATCQYESEFKDF